MIILLSKDFAINILSATCKKDSYNEFTFEAFGKKKSKTIIIVHNAPFALKTLMANFLVIIALLYFYRKLLVCSREVP